METTDATRTRDTTESVNRAKEDAGAKLKACFDDVDNNYKKYKEGTDKIRVFLQTFGKAGVRAQPDDTDAKRQEKPPGKSKRRQREKLHVNKKEQKEGENKLHTPKYPITQGQYIKFAEAIAKAKISVPKHIKNVIDEMGSEWWDNQRHLNFIQVLEKVRECVKHCPGQREEDGEREAEASSAVLADQLGDLTTSKQPAILSEKEAQTPAEEIGIKIPEDSSIQSAQILDDEIEIDADPIHNLMEYLGIFFLQMKSVRDFVRSMWKKYNQKEVDLDTVCNITNMVIEMIVVNIARRKEIVSQFEAAPEEEEWIPWAYEHLRSEKDTEYTAKDFDKLVEEKAESADFVGYFAYRSLKGFFGRDNKGSLQEFVDASQGVKYQNIPDGNFHMRYQMDDALLRRLCFALDATIEHGVQFRTEDQITRMYKKSKQTPSKSLSMELVMTLQIYLDIVHTRVDFTRACKDLRATGDRIDTVAKEYYRQETNEELQGLGKRSKTDRIALTHMLRDVNKWIKNDPFKALSEAIGPFVESTAKYEENILYRIHPRFCGTMDNWFKNKMLTNSIICANNFDSIVPAAHLYHAARKLRLLDTTWQDMEHILEENPTLLGKTQAEGPAHFWIWAWWFNTNNKREHYQIGILRVNAPIQAMFFPSQYLCDYYLAVGDHVPEATAEMATSDGAVNLLERVSIYLSSNRTNLNFDYYAMQQSCARLLSGIKQGLIERLKAIKPKHISRIPEDKIVIKDMTENWEDLMHIPQHIFSFHPDIVNEVFIGTELKKQLPKDNEMIVQAAAMIAEVIKKKGSVNIDKARELAPTAMSKDEGRKKILLSLGLAPDPVVETHDPDVETDDEIYANEMEM
ncbi:hypothetical protein HYALB_00000143 [Hymenoscyphus albidus]|uniref:DUF6604 domain-containing protein n=1 Tax=Hymenoscyphus albidus TaxID=595503 RepID=A0A9N9PZ14_9HELO|nr:hypothetical protein HYALB_00000143 [Hymenoscyphus albidus]